MPGWGEPWAPAPATGPAQRRWWLHTRGRHALHISRALHCGHAAGGGVGTGTVAVTACGEARVEGLPAVHALHVWVDVHSAHTGHGRIPRHAGVHSTHRPYRSQCNAARGAGQGALECLGLCLLGTGVGLLWVCGLGIGGGVGLGLLLLC
jgi:hypothetical protein